MRFWRSIFLACSLVLLAAACTGGKNQSHLGWKADSGKLRVLSTTAIVNDLVAQIGGEEIDKLTLISGSLDPHNYELVKGDDEKLAHAELIFASGLGLEHGPSLRRYLQESDKTVSLGDRIAAGEGSIAIYLEGELDPHIWMDASLWKMAVPVVVEELATRLPQYAELFRARGDALFQELTQLHEEVMSEIQAIPLERRYVITTHDCLNYFSRAYLASEEERALGQWQCRCDAPEGLAPEGQLSVRDIQSVVTYLQECGVPVLFPESNQSRDALIKIVKVGRELGMDVRVIEEPLYGDALGEVGSGGESYMGMMRHNARLIARSLNTP